MQVKAGVRHAIVDPKLLQEWEDALNPEVLRPRLIRASLFIAAFELLKEIIVQRIRDFFTDGWNEKGDIVSSDYTTDVLGRNRSPTHASLDWLRERGAISDADIATFGRVKNCRNALAHGLQKVALAEGLPVDFDARFQEMVALLKKIELWWIVEVEIPTNPDFDHKEIDYDGILPGHVMMLSLLYDVGLSSDAESKKYLEEFRRRVVKQGVPNNGLHQTGRGGAVASRPVVEARPAGEAECCAGAVRA